MRARHPVSGAAWLAASLAVAVLFVATRGARADDLKDGKVALQAGRYDDALKSFEKAAGEGYAEARAGVGQVWLKRRDYPKAMQAFQLAQKMDPGLALSYWGQGEVLRIQNKCDAAVPLFQKATELDRKFPDAQLALGNCLVELKKHDQAVAALNEGLKWGPKWRPKFLVALGKAEMARDSLRDAGIYFTRARQESPDDPTPRRALGDFYLKRGIPALAVPEYEAAMALDSTDLELRFGFGQALYYAQRYKDALEQFRQVAMRDPEFPPGQLALGNLYYLSGPADPRRYADARAPLEKYTQLEPGDAHGWSLLGRVYYNLRLRDEAVAALQKAEQLGEHGKEHYTYLGRVMADRKDWDGAMAAFAKGDPNATDLLRLGQIYEIKGNIAAADSVYRSLIGGDSSTATARLAFNLLGKLLFRKKDFDGAIGVLGRRNALDPNNAEAYYYIGLSYREKKQYADATPALRQAATLCDTCAAYHFWLALVLVQQDSMAEARGHLKRYTELDSTTKSAAIAFQQLGYVALLSKDWNGALHELERSVALNEADVQTWVWLGQAQQNSGNRSRALEAYNRALALDPKQPDALRGKQILTAPPR